MNSKVKKLTDETLMDVAGGLENTKPLNTAVLTDESIEEDLKVIYLDLLNQQRQWLIDKNREDQSLDESIIRRQMHYLDIEEEKLRYL